jgi:hypothetical protein
MTRGTAPTVSGGAGWNAWQATATTTEGVRTWKGGIAAAAKGASLDYAFQASPTIPTGGVRGLGGGFQFFDSLGGFVPGKIWLKLSTGDSVIKTITSPTQFVGFWVTNPDVTITSMRLQPMGTGASGAYVGTSTLFMGSMFAVPAPGAVALLGAVGMIGARRRR